MSNETAADGASTPSVDLTGPLQVIATGHAMLALIRRMRERFEESTTANGVQQ